MKTLTLAVLGLVVALAPAQAAPKDELSAKLIETWGKASDWVVTQQDASGCWKVGPEGKQEPSPSFTSIIVTALANGPKDLRGKFAGAVAKGIGYLESKANPDGSFGEGKSGSFAKTYSTALALMALATVDRDKHADKIRGAQAYLKQNQLKEGAHRGGNGYGDEEPRGQTTIKKDIANLSVTGFAAEGLEMSGLPKDDEYWKLVIEFVRKCQNSSEVNTDPEFVAKLKAKNLVVGDDGGLYYTPVAEPGLQKAGMKKIADKESIASYGSMTYEGIKTYLYAGLKKDSPEVKAAVDWVRKNFSVEGHPGFAFDEVKRNHLRGLYYYYLVMARALDAYGENPFVTFDGKKHDWPREIAEQLLKRVREDHMWQNDNAGWYEADPILVTSYALNTCDILLKHLK
jgi:squalene-hopene/tetraprenyl-beta-curcumene cyclase